MSADPASRPGRVTGLGGVFFKARDPRALAAWYAEHLGFPIEDWGGAIFRHADEPRADAYSNWSPFAADTEYFAPSPHAFMLNLRVDDVEALVARLRAAGVRVLDRGEDGEFGRFRYALDPEDHLLELWEPPA
jgi:catechol 2,3-dioxygenase-like lactoylglutathione lyase family enzyme